MFVINLILFILNFGQRYFEVHSVLKTYRLGILGIIFPVVRVSTSSINGIMESKLWWDENGVSQ